MKRTSFGKFPDGDDRFSLIASKEEAKRVAGEDRFFTSLEK
jgi:hypothetical protein